MHGYRIALLILFCLGVSPLSFAEEVANETRTWTSADGRFTTTARLIEKKQGSVLLEKSAGGTIEVPLSSLSKQDREYVDALTKTAAGSDELLNEAREFLAQVDVEPTTREFTKVREWVAHDQTITALAVSRNEHRAITVSGTQCSTWALKTGQKIADFEKPVVSGGSTVAITPDGKFGLAVTKYREWNINVFDAESGKLRHAHELEAPPFDLIAVSSDSKWFVAGTQSGQLYRYPLLGGNGTELPSQLTTYDGC